MKREKILKTILIILIIIILAFFVNLGRKTAILISIENKREKINEIDNIYYKYEQISDNSKVIREIFKKGNIVKEINKFGKENQVQIIVIETPEEVKMYVESEEKSLFIYNKEENHTNTYSEKHTFIENLKYAMNSKISTKRYNGEKCYVIEGSYTPYTGGYENIINATAHINKETGIKVKSSISANSRSIKSNRGSRV